ncbi:hypothetical protein N7466_007250 [Penicillium verhagenii]|uniref:uncharacterized protein n=1 Tax=Penicillium verhagenii TaxID=1562060 RepID=UPI0025456A45|nr:uncharacterized protein N7466_007250 [Penicillium verhagenii]KAJ5928294.1 hypothetical protein N7466_007250 [Penicillium verhagenii]
MEQGPHPNQYPTRMSPDLEAAVPLMKGVPCACLYQFRDGLVLRRGGVKKCIRTTWRCLIWRDGKGPALLKNVI